MKSINYLIALCFIFLISCKEPLITFAEPQPAESKAITTFPVRLQGSYFSPSDSSTLVIDRNMITKNVILKDTIPNQVYYDTIFSFAKGNILKKFRGTYFLNEPFKDNWEVKTLKLKNGILEIGIIASEDDISKMEEITATIRDSTIPFKANPTKSQLKSFVKENGFSEEKIFIKVR